MRPRHGATCSMLWPRECRGAWVIRQGLCKQCSLLCVRVGLRPWALRLFVTLDIRHSIQSCRSNIAFTVFSGRRSNGHGVGSMRFVPSYHVPSPSPFR
jgi:hypothetical protein